MVKIAVIGAGVNGVSSALKIKEAYGDFEVVIISEKLSPHTTGDGSGGLWHPFHLGDTPEHKRTKWGIETYNFYHNLWREKDVDISLIPLYVVENDDRVQESEWMKQVFGYRHVKERELVYFKKLYSLDCAAINTYTTFVATSPSLLAYLYRRFSMAGGKVVAARVNSLQDDILSKYDVVVNCSGLGARELVPDDDVHPVRGQIMKVKAPWIFSCIVDEGRMVYVLPNAKTCVMGGTGQIDNYSTNINESDTNHIKTGCYTWIPSLKKAEILTTWVGLRPGRRKVRLEADTADGRLCIHNYGHGGSGLTLFWGCASEALDLLSQNLDKVNKEIKSKL